MEKRTLEKSLGFDGGGTLNELCNVFDCTNLVVGASIYVVLGSDHSR